MVYKESHDMDVKNSENNLHYLTVSIVTPTFNSMRTLRDYLRAIDEQDYPKDRIELIIADGGSTDGTCELLDEKKDTSAYPIRVFPNPLRTAEAGKAVGVRRALNDIVLLLDSDNILPQRSWLSRMMKPFQDDNIIASEPVLYTYRKKDSIINRYCALIGMNDPLCLFTGNYDRYCRITGKWTEIPHEETDMGDYLSIRFTAGMLPTIGANGFLMRRKELLENFDGDYLFDIDVLWELFQKDASLRIAKVKTGVIHLFCPDLATFYRKQNRRIQDFLYFSDAKGRSYPWKKLGMGGIVKFCLSCVAIFPLVAQAVKGHQRKPDLFVWLMHPVMCWITLFVYGSGTIRGLFQKKEADRNHWKQ